MQLLKESGKHGRLRAFQRNGETGSFQDKYKHRKGMGGEQLAKGKDSEVREMATKYGVERYLGTERLAVIPALVKTWADDVKDEDPLTRSTRWLETKSEIEDILAVTALNNNSRETMYLLGSTATGQVSFEEVRAAYTDGYNTLMRQYANTITNLDQKTITDLERMRDRFFVSMPMFGSLQEKQVVAKEAKECLTQIENFLQGKASNFIVSQAKVSLGEKETTRTLILTQAEAGFRDGSLTPTDYQQVQNLIGRTKSLFQGQIKALKQYGPNSDELFSEMDRVLTRANDILGKQEERYALSGSFITSPQLDGLRKVRSIMGTTGDGIRAVAPSNAIFETIPMIEGQTLVHSPGSSPPWVGLANQMMPPPEPTVVANRNAEHLKFINPADVHRNEPMQSKFSAYHKQRLHTAPPRTKPKPGMAGVSPAVAAKREGLGATAAADRIMQPWVQAVCVVGVALAAPGIIRAMGESIKRRGNKSRSPDFV